MRLGVVVLAGGSLLGQSEPELKVVVQNLADVPAGVLALAEREVDRLFAPAGIRIDWANCTGRRNGCQRQLPFIDVVLRLAPEARGREHVLGWAERPDRATVVAGHVRETAAQVRASFATVLAHAAAHEIAHLLLAGRDHPHSGVMRGRWESADLSGMGRAALGFSREQGVRMRASLLARRNEGAAATGSGP